VAIHTLQALSAVKPVIELDNLFFDNVVGLENIFMAIQASLGSELIISKIFWRDKLITSVPENISSFRRECEFPGMALITACLICRMPV
jgi:hypothetical protein